MIKLEEGDEDFRPPLKPGLFSWNGIPIKILRWILFVPLGLLFVGLWTIPGVWAAYGASNIDLKPNLLVVIVGILLAIFVISFVILYFYAFSFIAVLFCGKICPNPKIGVPLFWVLFLANTIWGYVTSDPHSPWWTELFLGMVFLATTWGCFLSLLVSSED